MKLDYIVVLIIVGIVLCFLTCFVLQFFHKEKSSVQKILLYYFLTLAVGLCLLFTLASNLVLTYPHFFRVTLILAYVYPPLAYLYIRQNAGEKLRWTDLLFLMPALFYIIDYIPFFLLPAEKKLPIVLYNLRHYDRLLAHNDGWLAFPWFHMIFRNVLCIVFWVLSIRILVQLRKNKTEAYLQKNSIKMKWLWTFTLTQGLFFIPCLILVAIGKQEYNYYATIVPIVIMCSITCTVLFFNPAVFYGLEKPGLPNENSITLTETECIEISEKIDIFIKNNRPFLYHSYSLNDFAKEMAINPRKLSTYLNNYKKINYHDFINQYRVDYCIDKLSCSNWHNLTLDAISKECGFNNRNSFTTAFKKSTGANPSEYLKKRKVEY